MPNPKIKWNLKAFQEIRTSDETRAVVQDVVDGILEEVGEDLYKGEVSEGGKRAVGRVWTAGTHAERSNAKHNTLVEALGNAGGTE